MSLKEKLNALQSKLGTLLKKENLITGIINYHSEYHVKLEDHEIGDQKIYRLYYIDYHRIGEGYGTKKPNNIGLINWLYKPFMLPEGMSREDGFKVISYLTDYIETNEDVEPKSWRSVGLLDRLLNLERLGFKRVIEPDDDKVLNLFTVGGRLMLFKTSEYYDKYFEWYTPGVTREEVEEIYRSIGMEYKDPVLFGEDSEIGRVLKQKE